jgi:hypothetical protein
MSQGTTRTIVRWIHIVVAIPIYGYLYSPFAKLPSYAFPARYIFFPIMVVTGLWMWKGHVVWRLVAKKSAREGSGARVHGYTP